MLWYTLSFTVALGLFVAGCRTSWAAAGQRERMLAVVAPLADGASSDEGRRRRKMLRSLARVAETYRTRSEVRILSEIRRAGEPFGFIVEEWVGIQCAGAVSGLIVGLLAALAGVGGLFLLGISVGMGFWWPRWWLRVRASIRHTELVQSIPAFLDTLGTVLKAGVTLEEAISRVATSLGGPLGEEWNRTLREMRLRVPGPSAYRSLADRLSCGDGDAMVQALMQADSLGTPVSDTLKHHAQVLRQRHRDRAREQAAKAGPKITVITTFLTAPSVFLFVLAMAILSLVTGNGWGFKGLF